MNYVAIAFLVLVVFFILGNKKIIPYKEIIKNNNLRRKIEKVKEDIIYINRNNEKSIYELVEKLNNKYIIYGDIQDLNQEKSDLIIANFVNSDENICAMNFQYEYFSQKNNWKKLLYKLFAACLNYIEMLNRYDKFDADIVIARKESLKQKSKFISFTLSDKFSKRIDTKDLKEVFLKKNKLSLKRIISIILTILAGTTVTANIIYNVMNAIYMRATLYDVIACILIYIIYANIMAEIYRPMGIFRFIASYLFPLYIVVYLIFSAYYYIKTLFFRGKK